MAQILIKPLVAETLSFWIRGTSPLIQHAWSEKAKRMLRMTPAERRKEPKLRRDPETEAYDAMHKLSDGTAAQTMLAVKAAILMAAHKDLGIPRTTVQKALFLPRGFYEGTELLAPLVCSEPHIREDIVTVGQSQTDLRYRYQFDEWALECTFEIDPDILSDQDLINLVNRAGFSCGIGEWRPSKGGEFGRFEIDISQGIKRVDLEEAA